MSKARTGNLTGWTHIRFHPEDKRTVSNCADAAGLKLSAYVRMAAMEKAERDLTAGASASLNETRDTGPQKKAQSVGQGVPWTFADNDGAHERAEQLRRIGGNVNQIAKRLNALVLKFEGLDDMLPNDVAREFRLMPNSDEIEKMAETVLGIAQDERDWVLALEARFPSRADGRRARG